MPETESDTGRSRLLQRELAALVNDVSCDMEADAAAGYYDKGTISVFRRMLLDRLAEYEPTPSDQALRDLRAGVERICVAADRSGLWGGVDPRDLRALLASAPATASEGACAHCGMDDDTCSRLCAVGGTNCCEACRATAGCTHPKPEGVGTGAGDGAPRQDTASAWVNRSTDCPEAPAQAHPLAGRPNEAEKNALSEALWPGDPVAAETAFAQMVMADLIAVVERIVREHTDRALAEVEQRIASSVSPNFALRHDGSEDPQAAAYVEGLHDAYEIVRAARQEQGR